MMWNDSNASWITILWLPHFWNCAMRVFNPTICVGREKGRLVCTALAVHVGYNPFFFFLGCSLFTPLFLFFSLCGHPLTMHGWARDTNHSDADSLGLVPPEWPAQQCWGDQPPAETGAGRSSLTESTRGTHTSVRVRCTARPGKNGPKFKKVISSLDMLLFEFLTRKKWL